MDKIKFIDLFAGIGGMRLAFTDENSECVFSSEWDRFSQQTYEANFGEVPQGDITQIDEKDVPDHDILIAGFPCQPFSNIGRREGFEHATQGTLFFDVLRILTEKRPKAFLLENVVGLLTIQKGETFRIIKEALENINYTVHYKVLDSSNFGLPQNRKRIYIVGFSEEINADDFEFPIGEKDPGHICNYIEWGAKGYSISEKTQNNYLYKLDDGRPQVIDENSAFPVKTLVASYHKIQRLTGTFVRDGETGLRLLSELECKRIMGYPDDFVVPVSRTQMYRQFGNSVAVPVVREIANKMKGQIISGADTLNMTNNEVVKELFSNYPINPAMSAGELVNFYYQQYLDDYGSNNSRNGTILEEILVIALLRAGVSPVYTQAQMAFVPNVIFDILIYNQKTPVCISSKVSLRERWKQADIEAMAMKYVHRRAKSYVLTLNAQEVVARRRDENSYVGIDAFVVANTEEFDELIEELLEIEVTESETIEIIKDSRLRIVNEETILNKYDIDLGVTI